MQIIAPEPLLTEHVNGAYVNSWHGGNGYDFMERVNDTPFEPLRGLKWAARSGWGADGWYLGEWPYIIIMTTVDRRGPDPRWGVLYYVEGDITVTWHANGADACARIDELAHHHWLFTGGGPDKELLTDSYVTMPARFRGPYSVRDRERYGYVHHTLIVVADYGLRPVGSSATPRAVLTISAPLPIDWTQVQDAGIHQLEQLVTPVELRHVTWRVL